MRAGLAAFSLAPLARGVTITNCDEATIKEAVAGNAVFGIDCSITPRNVLKLTERDPVLKMALTLFTKEHALTVSPPALWIPPPVEEAVLPCAIFTPSRMRIALPGTSITPTLLPPSSDIVAV